MHFYSSSSSSPIEVSCSPRAPLRSAGGTAAAVFIADSPFKEFFYPMLEPYVHYVPVGRALEDLVERVQWANAHPAEVAAIAARGQAFARRHLHTRAVACFWWQLLTAIAALEDFEPRSDPNLGFVRPTAQG